MTDRLTIHLSTDPISGDLTIHLQPDEESHTPVDISEWPDLRATLREEVRSRLVDPVAWEAHLHSERMGERLDVEIGDAIFLDDGSLREIRLSADSVDDIDWSANP